MRRFLAGLALVGVMVGAPAVLAASGGGPSLSAGLFGDLDSTYLPLEPVLDVLALLGWALWAYLAVAVALRAVAIVIARRTGRDTLVRATDRFAPRSLRRLVDLAVGGAFLAATVSVGRAAAWQPPLKAQATFAAAAPAPSAPAETAPQRETKTYRVRPGDSLWAIAERELGTGFRWKEIFRLNRGRVFADGRCLENPRLIHPGWTLALPSDNGADKRAARAPTERASPSSRSPEAPNPEAPEETPTPPHRATSSRAELTDAEQSVPSPDTEVPQQVPGPVLNLPSGAVVAASFACGVLSAEMLTRLRRRRTRRPLLDDGEVEMPERLVRDLRHAGATPTASPIDVAIDEVAAAWRVHTGNAPRLLAAVEERRRIEVLLDESPDQTLPKPTGGRMSPEVRFERAGRRVKAEVRGPFPPRLRRVATPMQRGLLVPLGHAARTAVHVAPLGVGVLSVAGEGAHELIHQLLLAQATEAAPDELQITLLGIGDPRLARLPHVTRSADWNDAPGALQEIQAEFIHRARLFQREGVENIWDHLSTNSDEQLPALVVVAADPPASLRGLLEAIAHETQRYGGALLAVGWRPPSSNLDIAAEVGALSIETELPLPARLAPFTLDERTAHEAEEVIRQASIQDAEEAAEADSTSDVQDAPATLPTLEVEVSEQQQEPAPAQIRIELPNRRETPKVTPSSGIPAVHCLGPFQITRDENARVKGWRAKSRELLAYLIARPDGATKERIMDELWPGEDPERLQALFDKALSVARLQVRGRDDPRMYIVKFEDAWRLEIGSWWVDAFEFGRLVEEAERSDDEVESAVKLRQAIALYRGNFCGDLAYPWAEPVRERYRGSFSRASARLAEILAEAGEKEEALEVLDKAIKVDVLCEDLWRRAMTVESLMGRRAAAAERYKRLRGLLASELSVEPDPETQRLALAIAPRTPRSQEVEQGGAMKTSCAG